MKAGLAMLRRRTERHMVPKLEQLSLHFSAENSISSSEGPPLASAAFLGLENSPPEYYTGPNPHMGDLTTAGKLTKDVKEPYSQSISAGKNTYVYDAHTYHTKVPPEGIKLLIEYYTRPGDIVLDPFCGSGMTGVAATELGRKAILSDLSPAAAFIAYNLTRPIDSSRYLNAVSSLVTEARDLERRLYTTHCRTCGEQVNLLYMVWSFGVQCKYCNREFVLWDVARDERPSVRESKFQMSFDCPHCGKPLIKRELKRTQRYPVEIGYRCCVKGPKEVRALPNSRDLALLRDLACLGVPVNLWYPQNVFPDGVNTRQPIAAGITSVDKCYSTRALWAMAHLWDAACRWPEEDVRNKLLFTLTSLYQRVTWFSEFRFWGGSGNTANYNVPAISNEQNVFKTFERKAATISWYLKHAPTHDRELRVSVQSACHLPQLPDQSVDYIFTDPPFGSNINYSEMNFLWESWLRVHTNTVEEAVVNKVQGKSVSIYQKLLTQAFTEARRVLKDGAWLTVVFNNSSAAVWDALHQSIICSGFTIRGTQTFDKKHGTFKQFVSDNAVGYDLLLHCQKNDLEATQDRIDQDTMLTQARSFIEESVNQTASQYVVRYLHVARPDEFDYRRLYAEWLAYALPHTVISLNFEEFRSLVDKFFQQQTESYRQ